VNIAQLKTIKQNFVKELKAANAGTKTSLLFIARKLFISHTNSQKV
jgi:hypothetical protein